MLRPFVKGQESTYRKEASCTQVWFRGIPQCPFLVIWGRRCSSVPGNRIEDLIISTLIGTCSGEIKSQNGAQVALIMRALPAIEQRRCYKNLLQEQE